MTVPPTLHALRAAVRICHWRPTILLIDSLFSSFVGCIGLEARPFTTTGCIDKDGVKHLGIEITKSRLHRLSRPYYTSTSLDIRSSRDHPLVIVLLIALGRSQGCCASGEHPLLVSSYHQEQHKYPRSTMVDPSERRAQGGVKRGYWQGDWQRLPGYRRVRRCCRVLPSG